MVTVSYLNGWGKKCFTYLLICDVKQKMAKKIYAACWSAGLSCSCCLLWV